MWADKIKNFVVAIDPLVFALVVVGACILCYILLLVRSYVLSRKDAAYFAEKLAKEQEKAIRRDKRLRSVYAVASNTPILKGYLKSVGKTYMGLCPYDEAHLVKIAAETLSISFLVSAAAELLIISCNLVWDKKISFYCIGCCILAVYVTCIETTNFKVKRTEKRIMEDMIRYIAAVKHFYISCRDIPMAVSMAAEGLGHEMNRQALILHDLLTGTGRKEKIREYALAPSTNKYMKLFIQQAYEVSENGDIIGMDGESLFVKNLEFLRLEMKREMFQKSKRLFHLEGYTFVCLFPVFFMTLYKNWGMKLASDMDTFYEGPGTFIVLASFFTTVVVYDSINRAKEVVFQRTGGRGNGFDRLPPYYAIRKMMERIELGKGKWCEKIRKMLRETGSRQSFGSFVLTMFVYVLVVTLTGTIFFATLHVKNRQAILEDMNNIDSVVTIATAQAKETIKGHILDMTREYLYDTDFTLEELQIDFSRRMYMPNKMVVQSVAQEVQTRILTYRQEYLRWYEFYIALVLGVFSALIPYFGLNYRYNLVLQGKDDEIRQFQAIILMERLFPNITCVQILEEMENFARVFKPSLQKCINSYSAGPLEALLVLKQEEKETETFCELVDGFIAVDKVGVASAFAEVFGNREMTQILSELEAEKQLSRKKDQTDTLALLPAILSVGVYFVLPFCINVLSRLFVMFQMMEDFK